MLTFDRYRAEISAQAGELAEAIGAADLTLGVPTCPKWNLDKLVRHVGGAHRWAATMVERRSTEVIALERQTTDDHAAYLLEGAGHLVGVLGDAGPAAPVWTWTGDRTSAYWARRMTHETLVHRADAFLALGRPYEVAPDLAADCLDEWLELLRTLHAGDEGLRGSGEVLRFHSPDAGEWHVRLTESGPEVVPAVTPDVTASAPITDLLLVLLRRLPPDRADVSGRTELFESWLANTSI